MTLVERDAFYDDFVFAGHGAQDNAGLPFVLPRYNFNFVSFFNFHNILYNFRSKRYDRMPAALRELARHRTEDAIPLRPHLLTLLLDKHDRILIKTNIRTVLAGKRFGLPHDDGAIDVLFFTAFRGAAVCMEMTTTSPMPA